MPDGLIQKLVKQYIRNAIAQLEANLPTPQELYEQDEDYDIHPF